MKNVCQQLNQQNGAQHGRQVAEYALDSCMITLVCNLGAVSVIASEYFIYPTGGLH